MSTEISLKEAISQCGIVLGDLQYANLLAGSIHPRNHIGIDHCAMTLAIVYDTSATMIEQQLEEKTDQRYIYLLNEEIVNGEQAN